MDAQTVELVQVSFQKVIPIADLAMKIFYEKLFTINPKLKSYFPADEVQMGQQRNKLRDMLAVAVSNLSKPEVLFPVLENLGRRHQTYGVEASHYDEVGQALISTLEVGLGEEFTLEVKKAWISVYGLISKTMIEASLSSEMGSS